MRYKLVTVRKFKTKESFEVEGRRFYEGKVYEAKYEKWDKNSLMVSIFAENGYFNFTPKFFERVIIEWELIEVEEEAE